MKIISNPKSTAVIVLVIVGLFLFAGCLKKGNQIEIHTTLNEGGNGKTVFLIGYGKAENISEREFDFDEIKMRMAKTPWEYQEKYEDNSFIGEKYSLEFNNVNEYNNQIEDLKEALNLGQAFNSKIDRKKGLIGVKKYYEYHVEIKGEENITDLSNITKFRLKITMPGEITFFNQGEKHGDRIDWQTSSAVEDNLVIKSEVIYLEKWHYIGLGVIGTVLSEALIAILAVLIRKIRSRNRDIIKEDEG